MRSVLVFFFANLIAFGGVGVTSQEQFKRLRVDRSPDNFSYNFERAYLEVPASKNCPAHGKAFFFVHIGKEGDVKTVSGHVVALSSELKSVALKWAGALLKQMRFRPLMYGTKPSPVDTAVTLVCAE